MRRDSTADSIYGCLDLIKSFYDYFKLDNKTEWYKNILPWRPNANIKKMLVSSSWWRHQI